MKLPYIIKLILIIILIILILNLNLNGKIIKENFIVQQDLKICFIISHRYYRGYPTYIKECVDNILLFYPKSYVLIVDNNSEYIDDIKNIFVDKNDKVNILINDSICKYEIGAYKYGINWLIQNNILDNYDYYVFIQDTMFVKKKYDFNILKENNILAASIYRNDQDGIAYDIYKSVLESNGLFNNLDKAPYYCPYCSFIINKIKILDLLNYIKDIVIKERIESEASERYLGRILYELNNQSNYDIDGTSSASIKYNLGACNFFNPDVDYYFVKYMQQKNNSTVNK